MFWFVVIVIAWLMFSYLVLRGENLSYLDQPLPSHPPQPPSDAMRTVLASLQEFASQSHGRGRQRIHAIRSFMDKLGSEGEYISQFRPVQTADLRGEWVLAPGHDPRRRILYIHGGAFFAGSPLSHRPITDSLARRSGAAVFALDYRLMPEYRRIDGIEDTRRAYRWILENGPDGPAPLQSLVVGGDSAGGNLTLSLLAWVRDEELRQADAGLAFSPATDAVLDAPSLRSNTASDPMLGPAFGPLTRVPKLLLLWFQWFSVRIMPSDARISPLRGSLHDLPPILVQASDTEMLLDDARRYAAKAQAAESPVVLQTWADTVHAWQVFTDLPEADEAYGNVIEFLTRHGAVDAGWQAVEPAADASAAAASASDADENASGQAEAGAAEVDSGEAGAAAGAGDNGQTDSGESAAEDAETPEAGDGDRTDSGESSAEDAEAPDTGDSDRTESGASAAEDAEAPDAAGDSPVSRAS